MRWFASAKRRTRSSRTLPSRAISEFRAQFRDFGPIDVQCDDLMHPLARFVEAALAHRLACVVLQQCGKGRDALLHARIRRIDAARRQQIGVRAVVSADQSIAAHALVGEQHQSLHAAGVGCAVRLFRVSGAAEVRAAAAGTRECVRARARAGS